MTRMAIAALGLALFTATACQNLAEQGSNTQPDGRSTTSGGAALGPQGGSGPATGIPRTGNTDAGAPRTGSSDTDAATGDMIRPGPIPGENMLN